MRVKIIWYDMEGEKAVDIIDNAKDMDDAISKGYKKYNGNPPAQLYTLVALGG